MSTLSRDDSSPTFSSSATELDARAAVFCLEPQIEIFGAVVHPMNVFEADPLDVETIHAEARETFRSLLDRNADAESVAELTGRFLLILGEAGAGKTHLMRAFRGQCHRDESGYFAYMQMTSGITDYHRYMLRNLINSLDRPYAPDGGGSSPTGLRRLSNGIADRLDREQVAELADPTLSHSERNELAIDLAELVQSGSGNSNAIFSEIDTDLLHAFLLLQSENIPVQKRVLKYLRGEHLSEPDRERLGGLTDQHDNPRSLMEGIGRLIWALDQGTLVVCLDQFEDVFQQTDSDDGASRLRFANAVKAARSFAETVPNSLVIFSCLEAYYELFKGSLAKSDLDRIEGEPPYPLVLNSSRSHGEVDAIISRHLRYLFEELGVGFDPDDPTTPLPDALLELVRNAASTRTVLQMCRRYRQDCLDAGNLVDPDTGKLIPPDPSPTDPKFDQAWNDFLTEREVTVPDGEDELARLLAEGIAFCETELARYEIPCDHEAEFLKVTRPGGDGDNIKFDSFAGRVLVGICEANPQGGGLGKQVARFIEAAEQSHPQRRPVFVRTGDYTPSNNTSKIGKSLKRFFGDLGGRKVIIGDSTWRKLDAMREFRQQHDANPEFEAWLRESQPISRLQPMRKLLGLDFLPPSHPPAQQNGSPNGEVTPVDPGLVSEEATEPNPQPCPPAESESVVEPTEVLLGQSRNGSEAVGLPPKTFVTHMAFMGTTGSGKTTAALSVMEQLLDRGVPAILIDRKGDLASYAKPSVWERETGDPLLDARRDRLRDRLDVRVFTPGWADGNPLALTLTPPGLRNLDRSARTVLIRQAVGSLAELLKLTDSRTSGQLRAILNVAMTALAETEDEAITFHRLAEYLGDRPARLLDELGGIEDRKIENLRNDLVSAEINNRILFPEDAEPLSAELLFGRDGSLRDDQVRLSVISLKFLTELEDQQFWVGQLLSELARWMSQSPGQELQAVVLIDEADTYLPATSKPASKEPLENLLRRGRSAGLGMLLASQNVGDFDYRCRSNIHTWLLGGLSQKNDVKKMESLLADFRGRDTISQELAGQGTGEFYLVRSDRVEPVKTVPSFVRTEQLGEGEIAELAKRSRLKSK